MPCGEQARTFEGDDDDFFTTLPAPLFDVVKSVDQDACVDDDEICVLVGDGVAGPAWLLFVPVPLFWMISLSVSVVSLGLPLSGRGALFGAVGDGGAAAIRAGTQVGLVLASISPVPRGGAAGNRLFELFDLVAEECGTKSAGHGELVWRGCRGRSLGRYR